MDQIAFDKGFELNKNQYLTYDGKKKKRNSKGTKSHLTSNRMNTRLLLKKQ